MEQICAVIAPAQLLENPCNATPRRLHFSSARQRCVYRNPLVSARERGPDHPGQIDLAIWLGEQQLAGPKIASINHGVLRIAGGVRSWRRSVRVSNASSWSSKLS
jgi:hypothetical protein